MASRPKQQRLLTALRQRAHEELENPDATPLDVVVHFVAGGGLIADLARSMAASMGESISRNFLSGVVHGLAPDASEQIAAARRRAAALLAEDTLEIADEPHETREEIDQAKLRIGTRQWLAEKFNRDEFGSHSRSSVQITFTGLHLAALRQRSITSANVAALEPGNPVVDAEIVCVEGADGAESISAEPR